MIVALSDRWARFGFMICLACCEANPALAQPIARAEANQADQLCGAECLFVALCSIGKAPAAFSDLLATLGKPGNGGYSLATLRDGAEHAGCVAACLEVSPEFLFQLAEDPHVEVILLLDDPGHYLVGGRSQGTMLEIIDASTGRIFQFADFESRWHGHVLAVSDRSLPLPRQKHPSWVIAVLALSLPPIGFFVWKRRLKK